jgi:hypothetical protein
MGAKRRQDRRVILGSKPSSVKIKISSLSDTKVAQILSIVPETNLKL